VLVTEIGKREAILFSISIALEEPSICRAENNAYGRRRSLRSTTHAIMQFIYALVLGRIVQVMDAGVAWSTMMIHSLTALQLRSSTIALEGVNLLCAIFDGTTGFDAMSK